MTGVAVVGGSVTVVVTLDEGTVVVDTAGTDGVEPDG